MSDATSSTEPKTVDIAIVGGGIAGLYCALKYNGSKYKTLALYEATGRLGGRISTEHFPMEGEAEFDAEFGPMRIEPDQQELLKHLLDEIDIKERPSGPTTSSKPCLIDFPSYASPIDPRTPHYDLSGEEREQKTPLDLLKLAFVRLFGHLVSATSKGATPHQKEEIEAFERCLESGRRALTLSIASRQAEWKGSFQRWINKLNEEDYQNLREYGEFEYESGDRVPLWQMGFWNLMTDVLSHDAVMKLRDQGSFYHLIPENPNAVEWLVFWLRGLKTTEKLQGIEGGMYTIVKRVEGKIDSEERCEINRGHRLVRIAKHEDGERVVLTFAAPTGTVTVIARHVILALPRAPLLRIATQSEGAFSDDSHKLLNRCTGFPMTKVFVVVKNRWWEDEQRANLFAGRVPTRELHYWKSRNPSSKRGMIMAYSDRPGANFWANYLRNPGQQDGPEWENVGPDILNAKVKLSAEDKHKSAPDLGATQTRRLIYKIVQYLQEIGAPAIKESDIEHYGIRDWGREPYVAANHNWLPETRSWLAMSELSGFGLSGAPSHVRNVHVCGEAYSDYHGFIEGSLRTAAHVLHQLDDTHTLNIPAPPEGGRSSKVNSVKSVTPWLCTINDCSCHQDRSRRIAPSDR